MDEHKKTNESFEKSSSISNIPRIIKYRKKNYERSNYIPRPDSKHNPREKWHEWYLPELIGIYRIIRGRLDKEYKIDWENSEIFHKLSVLIYRSSSKYIDNTEFKNSKD
jgi:hypothetical protein